MTNQILFLIQKKIKNKSVFLLTMYIKFINLQQISIITI